MPLQSTLARPPIWQPSMFKGASGVQIHGNVTTENVNGDYFDESHTNIKETRVDREVYHQGGAVGVVNDGAKFSGVLNYSAGAPSYGQSSRRDPRWDGHRPRDQGDTPAPPRTGTGQGKRPSTSGHPPTVSHTQPPPSLFEDASDISIGGNVSSRTVNGNKYDRSTRNITKKHVPMREYHQEGAVGVVNGTGEFTGTLNYGGTGEEPRQRRDGRYRSPYPDPDETSSDDDYRSSVGGQGHYRDQRGSVGVVNDNGEFSGTLNYNAPAMGYAGEQHHRHDGGPYGLPPDDHYIPAPHGQGQNAYYHDTPPDHDDMPSIDVRSSSPDERDVEDILGMYDQPGSPRNHEHGSPYGLAPPPRGEWAHQRQGYHDHGSLQSPSPRAGVPGRPPHSSGWQGQYPPTPRSPGPPPYDAQYQGSHGWNDQRGPPTGEPAQGWPNTPTGLTASMANIRIRPQSRAAYPSPPHSRQGYRGFPPEKVQHSYYN